MCANYKLNLFFYYYFSIDKMEQFKDSVENLKKQDSLLDFGGNYIHAVIPDIMSLIHRALNKRIHLAQIKQDTVTEV